MLHRKSNLLLLCLSALRSYPGGLAYAVDHGRNPRSIATNLKGGSTRHRRPQDDILPQQESILHSARKQFRIMTVASSDLLWPQNSQSENASLTQPREVAEEPFLLITKESTLLISKVDAIVALVYFCNAFSLTLPIILVPIIGNAYHLSPTHLTSFCGGVASVAIMGGGMGKVINGIVCQRVGGIFTASNYLLGASICGLLLSMSTSLGCIRWLVAAMEFFASAMWVACSLILSQHHGKDQLAFARGVTILSLSSTMAQLLAKIVGSALLQMLDWRTVARLGATLALCGSFLTRFVLAKEVVEPRPKQGCLPCPASIPTTLDQIKSVLKSPLFWAIGLGHVPGYIVRTCDRMLVPFIADVTSLSHHVCGGLTAAVTVGFFFGVMRGNAFFELDSLEKKDAQLKRWYLQSGTALLGLSILGWHPFRSLLSPTATATLLVLCSVVLSSSAAFPFFQLPNIVSSVSFKENKAVSLSFLDGVGFFLTAPLWALTSRIVAKAGWSAAWASLAFIFGLGSILMVHSVKPVLVQHSKATI